MEKENQTHMALRSFLFIALGLFLLPSVSGQEPPVDDPAPCLFYGYSSSMNHYFLLQNDGIMYGNNLTIVHNCEFIRVYENDQFVLESNNSVMVFLNPGITNFTIETNDQIKNFQVQIIPDRLEWEQQYEQLYFEPPTEFISIDLSNTRENWAVAFSIVIVWVLATSVYWKLIESYVNKNFIEEVTQ